MRNFLRLLQFECVIRLRNLSECLQPILFFVVVLSLFPIALSAEPEDLHIVAPGLIWVTALLANLIAVDWLFKDDAQSGCLDQALLPNSQLLTFIWVKVCVHWLLTALPLIFSVPVLGLMLQLPWQVQAYLMLSLILATPTLSLLTTLIAALVNQVQRGTTMLALLLIPLYIPALIFAIGSVVQAQHHIPALGIFAILAAISCICAAVMPMATKAILRLTSE